MNEGDDAVNTRHGGRAAAALVLVAAVALTAASCSKGTSAATPSGSTAPGPRPSSTAHLTILSPTNGEVVHGSTVHLRLGLTGATIVPVTSTHLVPNKGHVHVYLDNQLVSMNFQLTQDIPNVPAGSHLLRAEFVATDHAPFDPRVIIAVTFTVQP
jgi:hypothetical protein